jgi:hypothetical protein
VVILLGAEIVRLMDAALAGGVSSSVAVSFFLAREFFVPVTLTPIFLSVSNDHRDDINVVNFTYGATVKPLPIHELNDMMLP